MTEGRARWAGITGYRMSRDTILFFGGLIGVVHETLFSEAERPSLLVLFGVMMGLPVFLRTDEKRAEVGE